MKTVFLLGCDHAPKGTIGTARSGYGVARLGLNALASSILTVDKVPDIDRSAIRVQSSLNQNTGTSELPAIVNFPVDLELGAGGGFCISFKYRVVATSGSNGLIQIALTNGNVRTLCILRGIYPRKTPYRIDIVVYPNPAGGFVPNYLVYVDKKSNGVPRSLGSSLNSPTRVIGIDFGVTNDTNFYYPWNKDVYVYDLIIQVPESPDEVIKIPEDVTVSGYLPVSLNVDTSTPGSAVTVIPNTKTALDALRILPTTVYNPTTDLVEFTANANIKAAYNGEFQLGRKIGAIQVTTLPKRGVATASLKLELIDALNDVVLNQITKTPTTLFADQAVSNLLFNSNSLTPSLLDSIQAKVSVAEGSGSITISHLMFYVAYLESTALNTGKNGYDSVVDLVKRQMSVPFSQFTLGNPLVNDDNAEVRNTKVTVTPDVGSIYRGTETLYYRRTTIDVVFPNGVTLPTSISTLEAALPILNDQSTVLLTLEDFASAVRVQTVITFTASANSYFFKPGDVMLVTVG